ncbi:MAG: hypothetical protein WA895_09500 [Streptosporangiaceae bacterium]
MDWTDPKKGAILLAEEMIGGKVRLLGLSGLSAQPIADSFWRQAALNAISPVLAAVLGGLVVSLIIQRVQDRRATLKQQEDLQRSELRQQEELQRAETEQRTQISLEMMRIAYSFYARLIELTRIEHHTGEIHLGDLPDHYQEFRIAARVLEERLRVYFPNGETRWLWHGAVDMLSVRYYRLAHPGPRLDAMIGTHGSHAVDEEIPERVRELLLHHKNLKWDDRIAFHNTVMQKFEELLVKAINLVVYGQLDAPEADPVFLIPGRGSRLSVPLPARPKDRSATRTG